MSKPNSFFNKFEADRQQHFDRVPYPRYERPKCVCAISEAEHLHTLQFFGNHHCGICENARLICAYPPLGMEVRILVL